MSYTTLREAGRLVAGRRHFRGNNVYSVWCDDGQGNEWYVVYSYGPHFPMYIYDSVSMQWLANRDKWGMTTSRHQTACAPPRIDQWHNTDFMKRVAVHGLPKVLAIRVVTGEAA